MEYTRRRLSTRDRKDEREEKRKEADSEEEERNRILRKELRVGEHGQERAEYGQKRGEARGE